MVDHKLKVDSILIFFFCVAGKTGFTNAFCSAKVEELIFWGIFVVVAAVSSSLLFFSKLKLMAFFDLRCYLSVFSGLFPSLDVSKGLQSSV